MATVKIAMQTSMVMRTKTTLRMGRNKKNPLGGKKPVSPVTALKYKGNFPVPARFLEALKNGLSHAKNLMKSMMSRATRGFLPLKAPLTFCHSLSPPSRETTSPETFGRGDGRASLPPMRP